MYEILFINVATWAKRRNMYGEDPGFHRGQVRQVCVVKSRTEQEKVTYSDKLKLCKLRKSLIDFQGATGNHQPSQTSKNNGNGQCVVGSLKPKIKWKTDQACVPDGP